MAYITTETENMAQFNVGLSLGSLNWQPTTAKSEGSAKRVSQRNRTFQHTIAHVAVITANSNIIPLAHRIDGIWVSSTSLTQMPAS